MKSTMKNNNTQKMCFTIGCGSGIAIAVYMILTGIVAICIQGNYVNLKYVNSCMIVAMGMAPFLGILWINGHQNEWIVSVAIMTLFWGSVYGISTVLLCGKMDNVLITILSCLFGGILGYNLRKRPKKSVSMRRRKSKR